jgi:undecaprenyl-diphosphatase
VALLLTGAASPVLKLLFSRSRPNHDVDPGVFHLLAFRSADASFPSGHSMTAFAVAGVLVAAAPRWRTWILAVAFLVPLARVVGGRHFVSDAVVGTAVGWALAAAAPAVTAWWKERRARSGRASAP